MPNSPIVPVYIRELFWGKKQQAGEKKIKKVKNPKGSKGEAKTPSPSNRPYLILIFLLKL